MPTAAATPDPWFVDDRFVDDLVAFVEGLRGQEYPVGVDQHVAVQDLILALHARGALPDDPGRLKTFLGPVLCGTPEEQAAFYAAYDAWLARRRPGAVPVRPTAPAPVAAPARGSPILTRFVIGMLGVLAAIWGGILIVARVNPATSDVVVELVTGDSTTGFSPIQGAQLSLWGEEAQSDSLGRAAFSFAPVDTMATLRVEHPDYGFSERGVDLGSTVATTYHIVLHPKSSEQQRQDRLDRIDERYTALVERHAGLDGADALLEAYAGRYRAATADGTPGEAAVQALETALDDLAARLDRMARNTPRSRLADLVDRVNAVERTAPVAPPLPWVRTWNLLVPWIRWAVALGPLLGIGGWLVWRWRRRPDILRRRSTSRAPDEVKIQVYGDREPLYGGFSFHHAMRDLRRHREVATGRLDPTGTAEATARTGGVFTPVYAARKVSPEYLVLINRSGFRDHQAALLGHLVDRLEAEGVYVDRYTYDGDPRVCYPAGVAAGAVSPAELHARHAEHRLLVFSDGADFMDPATGTPAPWLEAFALWNERALFTPDAPRHWGYREIALAGAGFRVLPATGAGVAAYTDRLEHEGAASEALDGGRWMALPDVLAERPRRWLLDVPPPERAVEKLCAQLEAYLGRDGYFWLAACAVYPEVHWELTLYLGGALHVPSAGGEAVPLIDEGALLALARLPWFRQGRMPDWFRDRLLRDLTPDQEARVRGALDALLRSAPEPRAGGFPLEIAYEPGGPSRSFLRSLAPDREPADSPLRDHVFLSVMKGERSRLEVEAPGLLRKLLFVRGRRDLGARPLPPVVLGAVAGLIGWFLIGPVEQAPYDVSAIPTFHLLADSAAAQVGGATPPLAQSDSTLDLYYAAYLRRPEADEAPAVQSKLLADTVLTEESAFTYRQWLADTLSALLGTDSLRLHAPSIGVDRAGRPLDVPPIYLALLYDETDDGGTDTLPLEIQSIAYDPRYPAPGEAVAFTARVQGEPAAYAWDFGDGTTDTTARPTHVFAEGGLYDVALNVRRSEETVTGRLTVLIPDVTPNQAPALRVEARAYPPTVNENESAVVEVIVLDADGTPVEGADVTLTAGAGSFKQASSELTYAADELSVSGQTNPKGLFDAAWGCSPCATAYELDVRVRAEGYAGHATTVRIDVRTGYQTPEQAAPPQQQQQPLENAPTVASDPALRVTPDYVNRIGMAFVEIPAGTFRMGSENGDADEQPVHEVRISRPFYMGQYEVTQAQWEAVMGENPSRFKGSNRPVETVSWEDVQEFMRRLNEREACDGCYRLPTEAEWEYAARAGSASVYSFGNNATELDRYAWYSENAGEATHPVGQKMPNPWGLYDIHGNVWEWVQDGYGAYPAGNAVDPRGPERGSDRVVRGGGWYGNAVDARSANRYGDTPDFRDLNVGFRVVRQVP